MTLPTDTLPTLLAELRRLAEAATPGRRQWDGPVWDYDSEEEAPWLVSDLQDQQPNYYILGGAIQCPVEADAQFIAATDPQTILALLDHIDALEIEARMYRYLRDEAHPDSNSGIFVASKELGDWGKWYEKHHTGKPLDETIAAALAEQGEPK